MTNREKYEAFRQLYGPVESYTHRRFDKLVRLLLDLPETDERPECPAKVGQFWMTPTGAIRVFEARWSEADGWWIRGVDANGGSYRYLVADCELPVAAWNAPEIEPEMPF